MRTEQLIITMSILTALTVPVRQEFEFRLQDARLDRIQPAVVSFDFMAIFLRLAVVAQHANFFRKHGIIRGNGSVFSTCAKVLARLEAESSGMAQRADTPPAILLARKVFGSVGLAGILNH